MDYKPVIAAECMNRWSKFSARYMGERGFSIGVDDVTPSDHFNQMNSLQMQSSYKQCESYIQQYKYSSHYSIFNTQQFHNLFFNLILI